MKLFCGCWFSNFCLWLRGQTSEPLNQTKPKCFASAVSFVLPFFHLFVYFLLHWKRLKFLEYYKEKYANETRLFSSNINIQCMSYTKYILSWLSSELLYAYRNWCNFKNGFDSTFSCLILKNKINFSSHLSFFWKKNLDELKSTKVFRLLKQARQSL